MGRVLQKAKELEDAAATGAAVSTDDSNDPAIQLVHNNRTELLAMLEKILFENVQVFTESKSTWAPRIFFTPEQLSVVDSLAMNNDKLRSEIGRVCTLAHHLGKAATAEDRERARQRSINAQAAFESRAPEIEQQIATLQREHRALDRERKDAALLVEQHAAALAKLQSLVPPSVKAEHERQINGLSYYRTQLAEASARLTNIRATAAIDVNTLDGRQSAYLLVTGWGRGDLQRSAHDNFIDASGWRQFVKELQEEVPELEKAMADLTALIASKTADANSILNVYVR